MEPGYTFAAWAARGTGSSYEKSLAMRPLELEPTKAFHLNSGFNCIQKCHICDAVDWENTKPDALWRQTIGSNRSSSPYWPVHNPLLQVPGIDQLRILPDSCHCFHLGWGVDLAASALALLARLRCFEGRTMDLRLFSAYKLFTAWVALMGKTTGVKWWSYKKLDMSVPLHHKLA